MKKLFLIPTLFLALPALAHTDTDTPCGMMGGMLAPYQRGSFGAGMGGQFWGGFGFLFPLLNLAFWVLTIALLTGLVRWVWKKGDAKK